MEPNDWDALRMQLRALVPDFHIPPPPAEDTDLHADKARAEARRLHLA